MSWCIVLSLTHYCKRYQEFTRQELHLCNLDVQQSSGKEAICQAIKSKLWQLELGSFGLFNIQHALHPFVNSNSISTMVVLFRFFSYMQNVFTMSSYLSYNIKGQAFMLTLVCEIMGEFKRPFDLV